ncbi:unnamed protein product [Rangifer tarandus platyrhynchus]|uniref:Uncharacterized protein n=1 Tax=Rangifer tarandus platyrhynchus TaxID=3082113 RepID=A0AC59ZD25_RANTA
MKLLSASLALFDDLHLYLLAIIFFFSQIEDRTAILEMPEQFHVPWSPKCATAASLTEDGEGSALVVLGHLVPEALLLQEGGSVK